MCSTCVQYVHCLFTLEYKNIITTPIIAALPHINIIYVYFLKYCTSDDKKPCACNHNTLSLPKALLPFSDFGPVI